MRDILNGPNIRLRALEPADVDLLFEWENDTTIWGVSNTLVPFSKYQIEEYVLNARNDIFSAKQLRLMVVTHGSGQDEIPVGTIDLFDFDPFHFRAGVGILISEPFREKGFAHEALQLLIHYAFTVIRLHQIYCNIAPDNIQSLRLFTGLGFIKCGIKQDWVNNAGQWQEEWMFQLINHGS